MGKDLDKLEPLSFGERERAQFLIVDTDNQQRNLLRNNLQSLGFNSISQAADFSGALKRLKERNFTHLVFSAEDSDIPANDFLRRALVLEPKIVIIAASKDPSGDDIFELLQLGARGFLLKPITPAALDEAILLSTKGEPPLAGLLHSTDRNRSLVAMVATNLDKAARSLKEHQNGRGSETEAARWMNAFRESARVARIFCQGGAGRLLESIQTFFEERGGGPATRLGRLRKKLAAQRGHAPRPKDQP